MFHVKFKVDNLKKYQFAVGKQGWMKKLFLFYCILVICSFANSRYINDDVLKSVLKGDNRNSIIDAIKFIVRQKNASMISYLLINADDPRISHRRSSYGRTVYQLRMNAIESITGISPNVKISSEPDSQVIRFYQNIFPKGGNE